MQYDTSSISSYEKQYISKTYSTEYELGEPGFLPLI